MPDFNPGPRSPFSDAEERKLASDLLEVANEAELGQVIGDLLNRASKGVELAGSKVDGPVQGLIKTVARKALPSVRAAVGAALGAPERDQNAGKLGSLVNQALKAKVAGMTAADPDLEKCRRLFEKHRQFVRLAGKAATAAATAPSGVVAPVAVAQKVLADAAKETLRRRPPVGPPRTLVESPVGAAAAAPARVAPVAVAQILTDAAREPLRRRPPSTGLPRTFVESPVGAAAMMQPAARVSKFAEAAHAAAAVKAGAVGWVPRRETPKGPRAPAGHVCSICELPRGSCQCVKVGRTGRWFRDGTRIVVNC